MSHPRKYLSTLALALFLGSGVLLLNSCNPSNTPPALSGSKLTRTNFNQIRDGMSKEEVRAVLGDPSSTSVEDKIIYKRTIWRYVEGDKFINVTFKNDELDSHTTNLGT